MAEEWLFWQERRASKATEALRNMLPAHARVIRDGVEQKILAEDLVRGDLILLEEGDKISADARIVEASDLQVDQSTLTGESNPVRKVKDAVLKDGLTKAERPNLLFAGTSVAEGNGKAVVMEIGMNTEFGKIAGLTQTTKEVQSPLQKELNRGEYSIVQIKVTASASAANQMVRDLTIPKNTVLIAITREDSLLISRGDSQILVDDEILALTDEASSIELIEIFGEH